MRSEQDHGVLGSSGTQSRQPVEMAFRIVGVVVVGAEDARLSGEKLGEHRSPLVDSPDKQEKLGVIAYSAECYRRLWSKVRRPKLDALGGENEGFSRATQRAENTSHHINIARTSVPIRALRHPWPEPCQNIEGRVGVRFHDRGGSVDL
mmetsp:Transcript_9657/g.39404  ORF Transcript_9657/g.39404 Transcript_9657/m.39404 type:complete len:149 (+) Transcript_9657:378-824(+)